MKFADALKLVLKEEQNVGTYTSTSGIWEVEVYELEGNLPHVHVTTADGKISAPRLDIANYFIHGNKRYIMSSKERKDFDNFMNEKNKAFPEYTNWEFCAYEWNKNSNHKIKVGKEKPNYRLLPSPPTNIKR